jgi:hypothetical protein
MRARCARSRARSRCYGPLAVSPVAEAQPTAQPGPKKAPAGKVMPRAESKAARSAAPAAPRRGEVRTTKTVPTPPVQPKPLRRQPLARARHPRTPKSPARPRSAPRATGEGDGVPRPGHQRAQDTPDAHLNRMRAEFGRPRLPHRSFMPELEHSAQERVSCSAREIGSGSRARRVRRKAPRRRIPVFEERQRRGTAPVRED